MKWANKGHEYDSKYEIYREGLTRHGGKFCIFGAGKIGKRGLEKAADLGVKIRAIIDNDPKKHGISIEGIPVISLEQHASDGGYIIICVSQKFRDEIMGQLSDSGLQHDRDFCTLDEFSEYYFPIVKLYSDGHLHLGVVELAVTERCTLRCRKCAHGCGYVPRDMKDYPLESVKNSADELFRLVDSLDEFYLIGGETLLYKEIEQAIDYVGNRYRDRINKLIITTNGTIIPSKEVVLAAKRNRLTFYISNYSAQIPRLSENYKKFALLLDEYGVDYLLGTDERIWYDYGFDYVDHKMDEDLLIQELDGCPIKCREIRGSKFYFCIQARTVAENMKFDVDSGDYLELRDMSGDEGKKILFEYSKGFSDKGYIDMCNYCNGKDLYDFLIPAAEQLEKGTPYR